MTPNSYSANGIVIMTRFFARVLKVVQSEGKLIITFEVDSLYGYQRGGKTI